MALDSENVSTSSTSFCEESLEHRREKDKVPFHYQTFYLYEKDGWKMKNCNENWSDHVNGVLDLLRNVTSPATG